MGKQLTQQEIDAARDAIAHAEADAEGGGAWDDQRNKELMLGVKVLKQLLKDAVSKQAKEAT